MNREQIKEFLPHREPMLLVDEIEMDGEYAVSKYTVTGDEFFVQGHFPGNPIVPGVILCEIMGQGASLLVKDKLDGKLPLYVGLDKVHFKHSVVPGDTVCVRSKITMARGPLFFIESTAMVGDKVCVTGVLSCMLVDRQ